MPAASPNPKKRGLTPSDSGGLTPFFPPPNPPDSASNHEIPLAEPLFRRFHGALLILARRRLPLCLHGRLDPEELVQIAWMKFFNRYKAGALWEELDGQLGPLLVGILNRTARQIVRDGLAGCRDPRREISLDRIEGALTQDGRGFKTKNGVFEKGREQTQDLVERARGPARTILQRRLEGYSTLEISWEFACSQRKVERVLREFGRKVKADQAKDDGMPG